MFSKLRPLQNAGVHIHLHCFQYGREQQEILNDYCEEVHYYPRRKGLAGFSSTVPYIVKSRHNKELIDRLLKDDHPILMEGIHCTWLLNDERFKDRKLIVRLHNIEHEYYQHLAKFETSFLKKWYFSRESRLLKKYEASIASKAKFLALTEKDAAGYKQQFNADVTYIPAFIPTNEVRSETGGSPFSLYHGNLSVPENQEAVKWLLQDVFADLKFQLFVAGKNPSLRLKKFCEKSSNAVLFENPSPTHIETLIADAHLNILPSFSSTGIKFKLLHALFEGRHCLVNREMIAGTGLEDCCTVASTAEEMKEHVKSLMSQKFTQEMLDNRIAILQRIFDNDANCQKLIGMIW